MTEQTAEKARRIGPYSRPNVLAKLDGRTREAALLRRVRADLTAHVGGHPTATQRALIDRAALLSLHVALFDARALESGGLSERDSRSYLAYSNSLSRCLRALAPAAISASRVASDRLTRATVAALRKESAIA